MEGKIPIVRFCEVLSIEDSTDADRIKVRLIPEDNGMPLDKIDYAFPLLPKMFHVKPKVGESVLVLLATANDGYSQRYYIGPVISQDHRIYNDPYIMGADSYQRGSGKKFDVAPRMDKKKNGILPKDNEVVVRGRKNADIQITDDDVRVKAGVKVVKPTDEYKMQFNEKNPSYLKVKYHENPISDDINSTASIVADKINLLSTCSPNSYKLTDPNDLITDEEMVNILETAYKLPYGEKLVKFLITFVDAFISHTHDFSMMPPNEAWLTTLKSEKKELLDNEKLLSDTVRIN